MRIKSTSLMAAFLAALFISANAHAVLIVSDTYNVTGSGTGFGLGNGVNSGINPPTTRLTGSAAANLRYIKNAGNKADNLHYITNNTKFGISRVVTDSSTITLSTGSGPFDFGPALNTLAASPSEPAVYELTIAFANGRPDGQRCSFAISSVSGTAGTWDFGIQLYRATTSDPSYTMRKRISAGASGGSAVDLAATTVGTFGGEVAFLIRVTDAGAESSAFSSRVQVSTNAGVSWIYDSNGDPDLPNGALRFPNASRFIFWDVAGGAGPVTYDDFSLNWISGPTAATRVWGGAGTDDNWATGANWVGGIAPATGDSLVFNGTTRQVNTNDITGLAVPWAAFNNGGFVLHGNVYTNNGGFTNSAGTNVLSGELVMGSTSSKIWSVANNSELQLNNTTTVDVNGDHFVLGGGTVRLKGTMNIGLAGTATPAFIINEGKHIIDGASFTSRGGYRIGSSASGTGAQTIVSNSSFLLTVPGANVRVGDSANPNTARLNLHNSTLTMSGGSLAIPFAAGATGHVSQVGGSVSGANIFGQSGAGTGVYGVTNGMLEPIQIRKTSATGIGQIYFNNATLRTAAGASNAFFLGLNVAEIQSGGLVIDAQMDIGIDQALSGPGSLIKSNTPSAVNLNGANTYSGNTTVQGGKLGLPTLQTNATSVTVADTAELGVNLKSPGTSLSISSLTFSGPTTNYLSFDLGGLSNPTAPMVKVNSLTVGGPVSISVLNSPNLITGQFVLVDYTTIGGGFQFNVGSLPPGVFAHLSNNVANSSIDLVITGVPGLRWTGAISGDWDAVTTNWFNLQTGLPTIYTNDLPVEFLDGAANNIINISIFPTPATITVSNTAQPYVWIGGGITVPVLRKNGSGSLTRIETAPDVITEIQLNAGSFVADNASSGTFPTILSGGGTFEKQGVSTLTMTASNTAFNGPIAVQLGILQLGSGAALGTTNGGTTIASGATLDVNNQTSPHEPVTVSGDGDNNAGAIIDSATGTGVAHNLTDVTLTGHTSFGGPDNTRWDIRVRNGSGPGPGLKGGGFNLTKVGLGMVSIACQRNLGVNTPYWQLNLGNVTINEGTLAFAESLTLGNPGNALTVNAGATLQLFDLNVTNPIVRNITMTDARLTSGGANTDTNVINGAISITGAGWLSLDQGALIINGAITGSGSLGISATDPGRVYLNGTSTFAGDTTVTNGTIGGTGSIAGNLVMLGGTNAPGMSVGTFTVNGSATLAGATLMELNRNLSPNSDRLVAVGALNFGGVLQVVLAAGAPAPQGGDIYQLFNKAGAGSFTTISLPTLSGGLTWDTSNLAVNGSITVVGASAPPTITAVHRSGNSLIFSGTGGTQGNPYTVISSTNITLPSASWTPLVTNVFGTGGTFSVTNTIDPTKPVNFYRVRVP